ncbi:MAG: hypothetical protein WAZ14_03355 [Patescibacteria group bacterium]
MIFDRLRRELTTRRGILVPYIDNRTGFTGEVLRIDQLLESEPDRSVWRQTWLMPYTGPSRLYSPYAYVNLDVTHGEYHATESKKDQADWLIDLGPKDTHTAFYAAKHVCRSVERGTRIIWNFGPMQSCGRRAHRGAPYEHEELSRRHYIQTDDPDGKYLQAEKLFTAALLHLNPGLRPSLVRRLLTRAQGLTPDYAVWTHLPVPSHKELLASVGR